MKEPDNRTSRQIENDRSKIILYLMVTVVSVVMTFSVYSEMKYREQAACSTNDQRTEAGVIVDVNRLNKAATCLFGKHS